MVDVPVLGRQGARHRYPHGAGVEDDHGDGVWSGAVQQNLVVDHQDDRPEAGVSLVPLLSSLNLHLIVSECSTSCIECSIRVLYCIVYLFSRDSTIIIII